MCSVSSGPGPEVCTVVGNSIKKPAQFLAAMAVLFLACLPAFSQTNQGSVQGAVLDQSGGAIAGAAVTVTDVARGISQNLLTDSAGAYVALNLTPGTYTVRGEAKGFQVLEHANVLVEVGQNIRVDLVLQPGAQTQTVTVTSEVPAINSTDAVLGGTVSNEAINALPLNGRNFERLLDLRPGNVSTPGTGTGTSSTNGRRTIDDLLRLEGIAGVSAAGSSNLLNAVYRGGDTANLVPIDAIQEFNETQNPKAQDGWRDGSTVNVGLKSGTNSLHGTAYAFGRDASATDAPNYFGGVTPATLEQFGATAGGPILKDKLFWFTTFEGLRVSVGDVTTNDTLPYDKALTPANPSLSMVDACNALGPAKVNPLSAQLAGLNASTCVVTPASPSFENVFPFIGSTTSNDFAPGLLSSLPLNNGILKVNYVLSPHNQLNGMYYISKSTQNSGSAAMLLPQWEQIALNDAQQYDGDWTWTPNSTWVNDFRLGYIYVVEQTLDADGNLLPLNPWPDGYGMNTGVTNKLYGGFPTITISGFSGTLGANARTGRKGPQGDVDLIDNVSFLRGQHAFKFGFEYLDMVFDGDTFTQAQGVAKFASLSGNPNTPLENFLQGIPSSGSIYLGNPTQNTRSHWFGGFFQDDWRIKPRLTLNLGLRYEYYATPHERNNYMGNFNPNVNPLTTPAVEQFGPGEPLPTEYNAGLGTLSPRFGLAWDVQGNGKTVVRAGASILTAAQALGLFIDDTPFGANFPSIGVDNSNTAVNAHSPANFAFGPCKTDTTPAPSCNWTLAGPTFPTAGTLVVNGVTYTGVSCTPTALGGTPCATGGVDPNFHEPPVVEWNLDVQRAITNSLTVDVAYVGNHGSREENIEDLDQPAIGAGWNATAVSACLASAPTYNNCKPNVAAEAGQYTTIFPYLNSIDIATSGDESNYDALQASVQARLYHGLSFLAGYTYAHALSETDADSISSGNLLPTDKNNLHLNYGSSDYDIRNRFTFSPSYAIPGLKLPGQMLEGWTISSIITVQGGLPWAPNDPTSTDWLGTGENTNTAIGAGSTQYWNYVGPASAFTSGPNPIPCFGKAAGCTAYTSALYTPAIESACQSAAQAPYAGNTQLQALALASLANASCYMQGGGILTPPAYGTLGDASRGIFRSPMYANVDFSVAKTWKFRERYSAQFRIEFFNLFNRADFPIPAVVDPSTGSGGKFGCSCSTPDSTNAVLGSGGPRHIQFGLKLAF